MAHLRILADVAARRLHRVTFMGGLTQLSKGDSIRMRGGPPEPARLKIGDMSLTLSSGKVWAFRKSGLHEVTLASCCRMPELMELPCFSVAWLLRVVGMYPKLQMSRLHPSKDPRGFTRTYIDEDHGFALGFLPVEWLWQHGLAQVWFWKARNFDSSSKPAWIALSNALAEVVFSADAEFLLMWARGNRKGLQDWVRDHFGLMERNGGLVAVGIDGDYFVPFDALCYGVGLVWPGCGETRSLGGALLGNKEGAALMWLVNRWGVDFFRELTPV